MASVLGRSSHGGAGWGHGADRRLMHNTGLEQLGWPVWAAPPSATSTGRGTRPRNAHDTEAG